MANAVSDDVIIGGGLEAWSLMTFDDEGGGRVHNGI